MVVCYQQALKGIWLQLRWTGQSHLCEECGMSELPITISIQSCSWTKLLSLSFQTNTKETIKTYISLCIRFKNTWILFCLLDCIIKKGTDGEKIFQRECHSVKPNVKVPAIWIQNWIKPNTFIPYITVCNIFTVLSRRLKTFSKKEV